MRIRYMIVEWGFGILIFIGGTKHDISKKIESVYTFIKRKYYGYKFRTVEDAAKRIMEKEK